MSKGGGASLVDGYAKERASALSCHYIICIISCGAQAAAASAGGRGVGEGAAAHLQRINNKINRFTTAGHCIVCSTKDWHCLPACLAQEAAGASPIQTAKAKREKRTREKRDQTK